MLIRLLNISPRNEDSRNLVSIICA